MINKGLSKVAVFFLYLLSLLPLNILYLLSDLIYLILFKWIKYRRAVVHQNLVNSFPDKSLIEINSLADAYFKYLADLIIEIIKMLSASPEYLTKRYSFSNQELIDKLEEKNQSYLIAVGHYGNWEWSTIVLPQVIKAKSMIIYKPMSNPVFDDTFRVAREKGGSKMINMQLAMREMIKHKNELTATVFASDQTPLSHQSKTFINFLHQPTPIFLGLEKCAKSLNYPVVFCDMKIVKRGYYHCDFKVVTMDPSAEGEFEITRTQSKLLENRINITPQYWLWSHKRWKRKPKADAQII